MLAGDAPVVTFGTARGWAAFSRARKIAPAIGPRSANSDGRSRSAPRRWVPPMACRVRAVTDPCAFDTVLAIAAMVVGILAVLSVLSLMFGPFALN